MLRGADQRKYADVVLLFEAADSAVEIECDDEREEEADCRKGTQIYAHKSLMSNASPFFHALFMGAGRNMVQETDDTGMRLVRMSPDVERSVFLHLLAYLYTNTLVDDARLTPDTNVDKAKEATKDAEGTLSPIGRAMAKLMNDKPSHNEHRRRGRSVC